MEGSGHREAPLQREPDVYRKLDASSRSEAVARAAKIGLLDQVNAGAEQPA